MNLGNVGLLILDFDGVVAPEAKVWGVGGVIAKVTSGLDGYGVHTLRTKLDIPVYVVSLESSDITDAWCDSHDTEYVVCNDDKGRIARGICELTEVPLSRTCYVGNDRSDIPGMDIVGYPVAVADAHPSMLQGQYFITSRNGGSGAVRQVCDMIWARSPECIDGDEILRGWSLCV